MPYGDKTRKGFFGPHDMTTDAGRAKQREMASKGGRSAHQKGTAHEWTADEARSAGRKGGQAAGRRKLEVEPTGSIDTSA